MFSVNLSVLPHPYLRPRSGREKKKLSPENNPRTPPNYRYRHRPDTWPGRTIAIAKGPGARRPRNPLSRNPLWGGLAIAIVAIVGGGGGAPLPLPPAHARKKHFRASPRPPRSFFFLFVSLSPPRLYPTLRHICTPISRRAEYRSPPRIPLVSLRSPCTDAQNRPFAVSQRRRR
jgi:hypothetical protein